MLKTTQIRRAKRRSFVLAGSFTFLWALLDGVQKKAETASTPDSNGGMDHLKSSSSHGQDLSKFLKRDQVARKPAESPPYEIVRDDVVGRHMVASRDIQPGEVIFQESPVVFGPMDATKPICIGCYRGIKQHDLTCQRCNFPVCSQGCQDIPEHSQFECQAFQAKGFRVKSEQFDYNAPTPIYGVVAPIRALILKRTNSELWELFWSHMSHNEKRKQSRFWREKTKTIIGYLKEAIVLEKNDIPTLEIILGIFLVNTFEISILDRTKETQTSPESAIQALFALASMPSHSCVANCTHDFSNRESDFLMTMRAVVQIAKGEDITHAYTEPLDPVLQRQGLLSVGKFFVCQCPRCVDPTELGTYSSALQCRKCGAGHLISVNPRDIESKWTCDQSNCEQEIGTPHIQRLCQVIKDEAVKLDPSEANPKGSSVTEFECFIGKYSKILHPNHVILIDRKYVLARMYGRMEGYEVDGLTDEQFRRKRELCEEVLGVLDKIMPGRMRKRGMMMYELHLPLVMLANRALQRGPESGANPQEIKANLKSGLSCLKTGLSILSEEPEGSFESKIVEGSKESVVQLEQWLETVCSSL